MSSLKAARADNYYYPKDWDPSKVKNIWYFYSKQLKGKFKQIS